MAVTATEYFSRMVTDLETKFSEDDLAQLFSVMVSAKSPEEMRAFLQQKDREFVTDMAVLGAKLSQRQYRAWLRLHRQYEPDGSGQ